MTPDQIRDRFYPRGDATKEELRINLVMLIGITQNMARFKQKWEPLSAAIENVIKEELENRDGDG